MRFLFLLLQSIFLFISFSYGQSNNCSSSISIVVLDGKSGSVLPNAIVKINDSKKLYNTNEDGTCVINNLCNKEYTLQINYIGFSKKEIKTFPNSKQIVVRLNYESKNLSNANVFSERTNLITSMSKTEIKGADLEHTRGLSLSEALKEIPGVTTLQTGPTISKPIIQGMHSNRILIINNGIRQEGQQWGSEHAPEIDAFIANKLTVIKGAGSIKYGSDAIGGVILVEPNMLPDTTSFSGELNLVGISNGRQGVLSGILEGKIEKIPIQWRVQGTLKRAGDAKSPNYYLNNTGFSETNFSWALGYKYKRLNTELFYSQFNTDLGVLKAAHIGNVTDLENAINSDKPLITTGFSYKIDRPKQHVEHELFKVKSDYLINDYSKIQVVLSRQYNLRDEYDKDLPLNDSLAALNLPELHYEITTYASDVSYLIDINKNLTSSIGTTSNFQRNTFDGRQFIPNFINNSYAVYSINQFKKYNYMIDFGVRYDYEFLQVFKVLKNNSIYSPERTFQNINFNTGIDIDVKELFSYHLNIGTAFRAPSVNELYADGLHHGEARYIYSNENLAPEYAKAIITGIEFNSFKRFDAHIDVYYKQIDGFIYLKPIFPPTLSIRGAFPSFEYVQNDAYFTGIDGWLHINISDNIKTTHKFNLVRAYNIDDKQYLPYIPSDRFENAIKYTLPNRKHFEDTEFSIAALNVLKQYRIEPNSDYKDSPDAYMIFNLDMNTKITFNKHIECGLTINNLFNTVYREYMNAFRYYADEPGTSVIIRIKYHF